MTSERGKAGAKQVQALVVSGGLSLTKASKVVAEQLGVADRTVRAWVKEVGLAVPRREYPTDFQDFNEAQRVATGNSIAKSVDRVLRDIDVRLDDGMHVSSRELRELATTFAILTDKRRLEDGEPDSRTEFVGGEARELVEAKIHDLTKRRKARTRKGRAELKAV